MRILIIDDSELWLKHGKHLLEQAGYNVCGFKISESTPDNLVEAEELTLAILQADVLLFDKDLGGARTSTPLICQIRHSFPTKPIIRWSGGYERARYMQFLGVTTIAKPTRKSESEFGESFAKALAEQQLILSGPLGILAALDETTKPDEYHRDCRAQRLQQLAQISLLATQDRVDSGNWEYPWMIAGRPGGVTKHELGHCICDGDLTADDIRPFLPALQQVIAKFEAASEIDDRFQICTEFIKTGNLDELELVRHCY